jgi:hypothetical protein
MPERLLGGVCLGLVAAAGVGDPGAREPDVDEPGVVLCLLEQRECDTCKRLELVRVAIFPGLEALVGGDDAGECLTGFVASLVGPLCRSLRKRKRSFGRGMAARAH